MAAMEEAGAPTAWSKQGRAVRARDRPGDEGRGLPLGYWAGMEPKAAQQRAAFGVK